MRFERLTDGRVFGLALRELGVFVGHWAPTSARRKVRTQKADRQKRPTNPLANRANCGQKSAPGAIMPGVKRSRGRPRIDANDRSTTVTTTLPRRDVEQYRQQARTEHVSVAEVLRRQLARAG